MSRILIVEDEANLLAATTRGLQTFPGFEIHGESDAAGALDFLRARHVDLVILDINLPQRSGLDVYDEIAKRPIPIPVIVTTAYHSMYKAELERFAGVVVLEKPVPLEMLVRAVLQKLQKPLETPVSTAFQIVDYLQLAGLGQHSLRLEIQLKSGDTGRIDIVDGHIWNVFSGDLTGDEALSHLLSAPAKKIHNKPLSSPPETRQMCERPEAVLMEAAKRLDESFHADAGENESPLGQPELTPDVWDAGHVACEQGWYKGHSHG